MFGFFRKSAPVKTMVRVLQRIVNGGYDAAETNDANRRHWLRADGASADACMSPEVRRVLRNRCRYEVMNNCHARGMVDTIANDTIGTGPRLQMNTEDAKINRQIEDAFAKWCEAIDLPDILNTCRVAKLESGEVFLVLGDNPKLNHPVKLSVKVFEADQVTTPNPIVAAESPMSVDGIVFDEFGNPVEYHILKHHPGGDVNPFGVGSFDDYDRVPAENVIHYFRASRPGQRRGVPEITPALPMFANIRRFGLATIGAAEQAANWAGILYSTAPAEDGADPEPLESFELEPRSLLTMPNGWRMEQMKAEHPTTTYNDFKETCVGDAGRSIQMPLNVAIGNSSKYNFASGRLDHQVYDKSIKVERGRIGRTILNRLFAAFLNEAVLVTGLLPLSTRTMVAGGSVPDHSWFWDGREHVDPIKEANAQAVRLKSRTTTYAAEYAAQGKDWDREFQQAAREQKRMKELGITAEEVAPDMDKEEEEDSDALQEAKK